ncbi:hypothetical protein ACFPIJ_09730 [Dactylosporangium cerinum]|uniref:Uncharacterized protein n=1 Tax=Dactylosporangium cerinum TaxID=1434730 RepID=A0ABV9VP20_9ACTN
MIRSAVTPDRVPCSTPDRHSVVALTIAVTNDGDRTVELPLLRVWIPNDRIAKPATLTTDPGTIAAAPGPATPWATCTSGDGVVFAQPLPPADGIGAHQTVELRLDGIVVNTVPGAVAIQLRLPDGSTTDLTVHKEIGAARAEHR